MYRLIFVFVLLAAVVLGGIAQIYITKPQTTETAVIGEKPVGPKVGNQIVSKLPESITEKQSRLLRIAYDMGKKTGFRNPEVVQSVILQETYAGGMKVYKVANPGPEAYFGPMQLKLAAAKDVLRQNPHLYTKYEFHTRTDDEIKANLILNEKFNIEVGAIYLKILQDTYGYSGRQLLNAYNRGPAGVKSVDNNYHYAVGAEEKLARWKRRSS